MQVRTTALAALVAAAISSAAVSSAGAQIIYDNGSTDSLNGNEMTQWFQAEDFSLGAAANIGRVQFWAGEFTAFGGFQGSVSYAFHADNGGVPGATLFSGTVVPTTRTFIGTASWGGDEYFYEFNVSANLGPGNYWLALHNGPTNFTTRTEMYWSTTSFNATLPGMEDQDPFGDGGWFSNGQEHAFVLLAPVPEPSSIALLGVGGLLALRRRR